MDRNQILAGVAFIVLLIQTYRAWFWRRSANLYFNIARAITNDPRVKSALFVPQQPEDEQ